LRVIAVEFEIERDNDLSALANLRAQLGRTELAGTYEIKGVVNRGRVCRECGFEEYGSTQRLEAKGGPVATFVAADLCSACEREGTAAGDRDEAMRLASMADEDTRARVPRPHNPRAPRQKNARRKA